MPIRIARIYDDTGGHRVLVDRLWPRGVRKEEAPWHEWRKDLAPSTELRKAYHAGEFDAKGFAKAYMAELDALDAPAPMKGKDIVLVSAVKELAPSHVPVLKAWLEKLR